MWDLFSVWGKSESFLFYRLIINWENLFMMATSVAVKDPSVTAFISIMECSMTAGENIIDYFLTGGHK